MSPLHLLDVTYILHKIIKCIGSSEEGLRRPDTFFPSMSVITISSGVIMPLQIPVGDVKMCCVSSRTDKFPSMDATYPRS